MNLVSASLRHGNLFKRRGDGRRIARCPFLLALWWLPAVAAVQAAPAPIQPLSGKKIPFLFEDERIYVPVRIAAGPARWFILDTGATGTILDSSFAAAEHLRVEGGKAVRGAGSGSSEEGHTSSVDLRIGAVPMRVANPAVLDLAHLLGPTSGRAPGGIIGSQFFREHFVDIDFQKRRIVVDPSAAARRLDYSASVPLAFLEWTPLTQVILRLGDGRRIEAKALVDLGAKSTFLVPEPFIAREKLRTEVGRKVVTAFGAGVGGDTFYAFARARRLSLGGAPSLGFDRPVIGLSVGGTLRSTWNEGLLGAQFLSNFRIGFDYRHRRLFLSPALARPQQFDRSGLFLVAEGESLQKVVVREVIKNSPADEAGFLRGDEIVAIGGSKAGDLGLAGIRQSLRQSGERRLVITYRRGSEERTALVELRDLI